MRIHLETERLVLRNLTPDDYQAVFLWCGDPDVARYGSESYPGKRYRRLLE